MATATKTAESPYRDEQEESRTLERFHKMPKKEAEGTLRQLVRDGEIERAFDLVYKNPHAALCAVGDKELASIAGKGLGLLGHHAVLFQAPARWYVMEHPHSDVARLRVNPANSKWMYSVLEQARRA